MSSVDNNLLSFNISVLEDIKAFLVVNVLEVHTFIGEDLPPFTAGAPDSHGCSSS
jgi:hypothetical protein